MNFTPPKKALLAQKSHCPKISSEIDSISTSPPLRQCSGELLQQSPSGMAEVRALAVNPSAPKNLAVADSSGRV